MGFGLRELKIILNTIKEIAVENNNIFSEAVDKFFESLEQRYDIKLRQKVLKEQQLQKYNNTTKTDSPNRTFPLYCNNESSNVLPKPSALVEKQGEMPSSSISYRYGKITTSSKRGEEQNKELNPYHNEWDGSDHDDDDQFLSSS